MVATDNPSQSNAKPTQIDLQIAFARSGLDRHWTFDAAMAEPGFAAALHGLATAAIRRAARIGNPPPLAYPLEQDQ